MFRCHSAARAAPAGIEGGGGELPEPVAVGAGEVAGICEAPVGGDVGDRPGALRPATVAGCRDGGGSRLRRLRDRARIPPWPLIREYYDASVQAVRDHPGIRAEAVTASAAVADPWRVVEEVLASLDAQGPTHI
jgi:hypothetical protein